MLRLLRQLTLLVLSVGTSLAVGWLLMDQLERDRQMERLEAPEDIPLPLKRPSTGHMNGNSHKPAEAISAPPAAKADTSASGDDLTVIVGIGPVYAQALHDLEITTFAVLAQQDPDDLAQRMQTRVTADRIREEDWIGQAKQLSQSAK